MPDPSPCPDCQTLQRFLLGQNTPEEAAAVEAHLEGCEPCLASLQSLHAADSLVQALQARSSTVDVAMNEGARLLAQWLKKLRPEEASTVTDDVPPRPAMTELGQYQLRRILGSGGMGIVFKAYDPQLDRLVALKTMLPAQAANPSARQRFLREAKAAAAIKHDHIVTIYQVGEDRGIAFLAMELLEGETLDQRLDREGCLPLAALLRIGRECAEALAAAHAKGLIHRDVKPANIWLEERSGRVKLVDVGLARAPDDTTQLTLSGVLVGTPAFMAPEQLRGQPVDARADLFSLGFVLYRMATGEAPFKAAHAVSTLIAIATTNPRAPQDLQPDLPPPLCELLMRLLAKHPDERPPSAQAVVALLRAIEQGADAPAAAKRSYRPIGVIAAALVACVLAWTAYQLWPAQQDGNAGKADALAQVPAEAAPPGVDPANTVSGNGESPTRVHADRTRGLEEVLDFRERIGASAADFRAWHAQLEPGFRLAFVTSRRGSGPALLNAVAVREKTPRLVRVVPELSSADAIDEEMRRSCDLDEFSLLDHCTYPAAPTGWAQARIWLKDRLEILSWNADLWNIKIKFAEQKGLGRRPRGLQWRPVDPWPYQAIFADDDQGRSWEASYALSPAELVRAVQRQRHKHWRPDLLAPFWEENQLRFVMIAVENADGPDWRFRMDMTTAAYRQESDQQRRLGFFPICLSSYDAGADVRYVAVWVRGRHSGPPLPPESLDPQTRADRAASVVSWAGRAVHGIYKDEAHALGAILDYQQVVGATSEQFKLWHEKLDPKFRVAHLYSRKGRGPVLFDAVAVQEANPPPHRFHIELTEEAWAQKCRVLQGEEHFRPIAACSNLGPGQKHPWNVTALWVKDGQDFAYAYGWMENITKGISDAKAENRPIYLAGTESPDGLGCNTVVAPAQGRKWEVFYGLNQDEVLPTLEFYRNKGWRPDVIAPYWQGDKLRSMLVVVDNFDKVDWRFRTDMSRAEYEDESNRQKQQGLFPLALASYGHEDAVRYTAIFVRYRQPAAE